MAPPTAKNANNQTSYGVLKANSLPRRAYVTFLAGNGDYWKGVVGLAKGLRKAQSVYPLVVAVLPDVPLHHRNMLLSQGCIIREIEPVYPPENPSGFVMPHYIVNYSKLRMWEVRPKNTNRLAALIIPFLIDLRKFSGCTLFSDYYDTCMQFVEYSKMVYLDGDTMVFDNIDHLFDLPDGFFYAVMDCFCEKSWSHTNQYKVGYCQQSPKKVQWPEKELGPKPPPYFNAGVCVFEPNLSTYNLLLEKLKVAPTTRFAEQDFLNMFFRDVYKPIPNVYNLTLLMLWRHPDNVELEKIKVVHYTCAGEAKPWRVTGNEENMDREDVKMFVDKWWEIYNDDKLDYWRGSYTLTATESKPPLVINGRRNGRYAAGSMAA
ncbi:putative inositol 3-alpha-galactosyltransferase [Helianthus annuus]|nr:putative inositol 3-alpha-galactosyltransferase [Helianthus annuus]KAJ0896945.1 putative inositol 3-alpha-galactosyltransferase [Helianthus annuus]